MKAKHLSIAALWTAVAVAVPHRQNHKQLHEKRVLVTDTTVLTSIVTVTSPSIVVWVDDQGKVVSTETRGLTPASSSMAATQNAAAPSYSSTTVPDAFLSPVASASSDAAAMPTIPSAVAAETSALPTSAAIQTPTVASQLPVVTPTNARIEDESSSPTPSSGVTSGFNVCYDLMASGGGCRTAEVMDDEFKYLASQGFTGIRVYDVGCNVATAASKAAAHGLKVFAGINQVNNVASDLGKLVTWMNGDWSSIDTINIGNEVINSGGSVSTVVAAIQQARGILSAAGYTGKIVTVDTFGAHLNNPDLCAASDYCAVNAHAFFNSDTPAENAGKFVMNAYNEVVAKSGGKSVVITESGWPHSGSSNGAAVPSRDNQQTAIAAIKQSFAGMPGSMYLFQAYDAGYKAAGYLGVEPYFGIYTD